MLKIWDRVSQESFELIYLSEFAAKSVHTKGRLFPREQCQFRTVFQRDRDKILHSKAFRRLKHKTQVFLAITDDHYRTRITHTLEVSQISRTIARALRLNEDLVEAIALGHDLGHTPFGHTGESILNELVEKGFRHNEQSLRVVDVIENMNLTWEVRDGILRHSKELHPDSYGLLPSDKHPLPYTLEGQIVRLSDMIAYLNHDIDDAVRAKILKLSDFPEVYVKNLGYRHSERITRMVKDVVENSIGKNQIMMSAEIGKHTWNLRQYMFDNVYLNPMPKKEEAHSKHMIRTLYNHFMKHPDKLKEYTEKEPNMDDLQQDVVDYIAGMTDRFAVRLYESIK